MKKIVMSLSAFALALTPINAFAQIQGVPNTTYVDTWIAKVLAFAQQATTFLMIAATIYFLWVAFNYIREKDAAKANEKRAAMGRGILALVIMVGLWGIVKIVLTTLGIGTGNQNINIPCPPGMTYQSTATPPRCM
jgi:hypothetical protein